MRFTRLTPTEYEEFTERVQRLNFMQLPAFARARAQNGARVEYVGVKDGETVIGAGVVTFQRWKKLFSIAHLYFGPTFIDDSEQAQWTFYRGLILWLRQERTVVSLELVPPIFRRTYSDVTPQDETTEGADFEKLAEKIDAERVTKTLYDSAAIQPSFAYTKFIDGMDFAAAAKSTGQQVRTAFNRWGTNGVEVRFAGPEEIDVLGDVLAATAERTLAAAIDDQQLAYYQTIMREAGPEEAFLPIATLHTDKALELIARERGEIEAKIAQIDEREADLTAQGKNLGKKQVTARNEAYKRLEVLASRESETRELQEKHGTAVTLAASFFIKSGDELVYLVSGAFAEFNSYYGIYMIHRAMFDWATSHGIKWYNFWGISGDFSEDAPDAGVLHFKRQFNGYVEEYVGQYEVLLRPRLAKLLGASLVD